MFAVIRTYETADAAATLSIFVSAVTETAVVDYTPEQITAWAQPGKRNLAEWNISMFLRTSFVAEIDGEVAGFSDVSRDGHIDMMFVSPKFQRRGIAGLLLSEAESRARANGADELTANVSITARPFFEHRGFTVEAEQKVDISGVRLTNFSMRKLL